jgi:zinc protease
MFVPGGATLVVAGDAPASSVAAAARARFVDWAGGTSAAAAAGFPTAATPRVLLVDRPGAPQSELRLGHLGPPRVTPVYHDLVTLNAALGGQFTSRINQNLREAKGYTYGARTGFDFRKACGSFSCDTSVQSDATASAVAEVLGEFEAARSTRPIDGDELNRAKQSLTRGYVRHFETPAQLVRSVVELATHSLPDDTFDRFVPAVSRVTAADVLDAAQRFVRPAASVIVVVGDAASTRQSLAALEAQVVDFTPEF